MASIAICTITYNQQHCVDRLIANIKECRGKDRFFHIRDDCSTDETFNLCSASKANDIEVSQNTVNLGSRLNGVEVLNNCSQDYIICKGGDDLIYGPALEKAQRIIQEESPDLILCKAGYIGFDSALQLSRQADLCAKLKKEFVKNSIIFDQRWDGLQSLLDAAATLPGLVWTQGLIARTSVLRRSGYLPGGEVDDWGLLHNLAVLARHEELKVAYLDDILSIIGFVEGSQGTDPARQLYRQLHAIEHYWHDDLKKAAFCNSILKKISGFMQSDVSYRAVRDAVLTALQKSKEE